MSTNDDRVIHADCGHDTYSSLCWEREGATYCEACFAARLKTAHGAAYEKWFVDQFDR